MSTAFRLNMAGSAVPSSVSSGISISSWESMSSNGDARTSRTSRGSGRRSKSFAFDAADEADEIAFKLKNESMAGILGTALEIIKEKSRDSELFSEDYASLRNVPRVKNVEMTLGKTLGRGGFCTVQEIEKLRTKKIVGELKGSKFSYVFFSSAVDKIKIIREHKRVARVNKFAKRSGAGEYALKRVSPHLKKNKLGFLEGSVDLVMEAKFLASCDHPNIIQMPGMGYSGPCTEDFFIVLEKLTELLPERIRYWSYQLRLAEGVNGFFGKHSKIQEEVLVNRLEVALEIANGMAYLHSKKIVFRDLKPDNIGFDRDGTLKLFDFGLAKELKESERLDDGNFRLTGFTGSVRYMAPEVCLGQPYELSCDAYSFSMLLWHMLALEPPFAMYSEKRVIERVQKKGKRPEVFKKWPRDIGNMLRLAWGEDTYERPSFVEIVSILKQEVIPSDGATVSTSASGRSRASRSSKRKSIRRMSN